MKFFISLSFLFTWFFSIAQEEDNYQLLWEITGKKLKKPSYVFGSMHSNDPRLFQFPDSLYTAFVKADAIVLETDISALFDEYDVRLDVFNLEILQQNKPYTNSREATRTTYGSEDGRPQFLDAHFQQAGYCGGKKFFPLEQLAEQLEASGKLEELAVNPTVRNMFFSKEMFVQYYLQGDIATLSKMLKSQLSNMPGAYETLITDRNKIMANGLDTLMRKQSVFCAVGSGHLYGTDGVLQLLRAKGYNVRAVTASYGSEDLPAKKLMNSWKTYTVAKADFSFSIDLGGKPLEFSSADNYRFVYQELGQGNSYELLVHPGTGSLEEMKSIFVYDDRTQPKEITLGDGTKAIEGYFKDPWKGLQWRRIIIKGNFTYELICYGGNKFMHSDRPKRYFNKLNIN